MMKKLSKAVTLSLVSLFSLNLVGCATTPKGSIVYGVDQSNSVAVAEVVSNYVVLHSPAANTNLLIIPDQNKSSVYETVKTNLQKKGYAIAEAPVPVNTTVTVLKYRVSPIAENAVSVVINLAGVEAVGMALKPKNQPWQPFFGYTVKEN